MIVGDDEVDPVQPARFEPAEEVGPAALRLAISQLQPHDLAVPLSIDTGGNQGAAGADLAVLERPDDERVHEHEGEARRAQVALIPRLDERVVPLAQVGDGGQVWLILADGRFPVSPHNSQ